MAHQGSYCSFYYGIHQRISTKIDISISTRLKTIKFGKKVHLQELNQMRLIKQVLVTSSRQGHVTNKKLISTTRLSNATKLGKMVTYLDGLQQKVAWPSDHSFIQGHNHPLKIWWTPSLVRSSLQMFFFRVPFSFQANLPLLGILLNFTD